MPALELVSRDARRLELGGDAVEYLLVRRRGRRGVGLKVDEKGLTVSAPATMPLARIEALVMESERWVLRKIAEWRTRQVPAVAWESGAALPYLGAHLTLRVAAGTRAQATLADRDLQVVTRTGQAPEVQRTVVAWYKRAALEHLAPRVMHLAARARLEPPRLFISSAIGRWGSCNSRREVRLSWRLLKAPAELIDYVVCHELAHLRHMNHSRAFWAEVERQCPGHRELRDRLFATDHLYRSF